jgi:ectoine hydroxylase-related dioxygenase (phytanoyl-CoA dioxygenase family)
MSVSTTYKNYDTTLANVKRQLNTYGIAVIPSVLSQDEIAKMQGEMWNILETLTSKLDTPVKRDDNKTWKSFYELLPLHSMLLQHYKVGHHQSAWDIRQNPNVVNVFSKIWGVKPEELLTSFDGCSIHLPPEITGRGWYRGNSWLHTDQSYTRNNLECIQGFITAFNINDGDASLTILEKSHRLHKKFAEKFKITNKDDWYKLNDAEMKFYTDSGCDRTCVKATAGSLILWDSRTIHCGQEPDKNRKIQNHRFVIYVCQTPRKRATNAQIAKKQKAFNDMRTTSHWPHKIKLFPINPRSYGAPIPKVGEIKKPTLSELGMKLAGF